MNEKKLLFFIAEKDGRVRQIVNGVVTSLNKKTPLGNNPDGHSEIAIIWERNMQRYGMSPNFGLPLGFVLDGKTILWNDSKKFNIDRELYLIIKHFVSEINETYYKEYYKHFYKGEFDFSSLHYKRKDRKVEVALMQGGNSKLLKAFEGTRSEYRFDDDHVNILSTGIDLYKSGKYELLPQLPISFVDYGSHWNTPMTLITTDGESSGLAFGSQQLEEITAGVTPFETWIKTSNWFDKNGDTTPNSIVTNIKGKIKFRCTKYVASSASLKINFYRSNQTVANQALYLQFVQSLALGIEYEYDVDVDIPVAPGESCIMVGQFLLTGTNVEIEFLEVADADKLRVTFKNKYKDTLTKAFRAFDLYRKICERAGIDANDVVSELLKQCSIFFTCGDALRMLDGAAIKTHFNDFWKAIDVYLMAGASVEQKKVIIEHRSRFFDATNPVELGDVILTDVYDADDLQYSSIKVGHAEQDVDDLNGKYDFNGYQIYSTPIKRIGDKQLDLQSPYTASPYEIEKVRTNYDGKLTTDANSDNKVYVIDVNLNGSVSIFNLLLSFSQPGQYIIFDNTVKMAVGQRFVITGTVSSNNLYTVTRVDQFLTTQTVYVDIPILVSEFTVMATLEFLTGQVYEYDRSTVVDSGLPSIDTIFNVRLHPYLLLQKHLGWVHGFLDKYDGGVLRFEENNRNKDIVVGGIEFKRDIDINSMPPKMFKPTYFELTAPTPAELYALFNENPNRCFSFSVDEKTYIGFNMTAAMAADIKPQDFKLLSIDQDITTIE